MTCWGDGMGSAQYPILPYTGSDGLSLYVCNGGVMGRVWGKLTADLEGSYYA